MPAQLVLGLIGALVFFFYLGCRLIWICTKDLPAWERILFRSSIAAMLMTPCFGGHGGTAMIPAIVCVPTLVAKAGWQDLGMVFVFFLTTWTLVYTASMAYKGVIVAWKKF